MSLLHLDRVSKVYEDGRSEVWALRDVSMRLEAGEIVLLMGPSGSGKSTLLSLAGGLSRPSSGTVELADKLISKLPQRQRTLHRRRHVGFVFQRLHLLEGESVLDNVTLPLVPMGVPASQAEARALALLEELGLGGLARARVRRLSGGEMQRVVIARAMICEPSLLLADEPTAHLDSARAASFLHLLSGLRSQGLGLLVASHDPRVARGLDVDRIYEIEDGVLKDGRA